MATFKCKDIVSLSANDLYEMNYAPKCPYLWQWQLPLF